MTAARRTLEEIEALAAEAELSGETTRMRAMEFPRLLAIAQGQREEIARLRHFGGLLANCAFNLKQIDVIPERFRTSLRVAQEDWDAAAKGIGTKK